MDYVRGHSQKLFTPRKGTVRKTLRQQSHQRLGQPATRSHRRNNCEYEESTGQDVKRYGHLQLRSYLAQQACESTLWKEEDYVAI